MTYADSSFLLRLLCHEAGSEAAVAMFRRLGRPALAFSPLHEVEVRNGLRLKAFLEKKSLPSARRSTVDRSLANWESRLAAFLVRNTFTSVGEAGEEVTLRALKLSERHTLQLGTRAYDILHVAFALELHLRQFITCDLRQAALAKAAGLVVTLAATQD